MAETGLYRLQYAVGRNVSAAGLNAMTLVDRLNAYIGRVWIFIYSAEIGL